MVRNLVTIYLFSEGFLFFLISSVFISGSSTASSLWLFSCTMILESSTFSVANVKRFVSTSMSSLTSPLVLSGSEIKNSWSVFLK